jgi:LysR family transcriptional regulator (chromosome initiation inhibitor)
MFPDSLAASRLGDGSFVRVSETHLEVPLYRQCCTLDKPLVGAITDADWLAAADWA